MRPSTANYSQGFQITNLVGNTSYSGQIKLTGASGAESPTFNVSFTTLTPTTASNVSVQVVSSGASVSYSPYADIADPTEIILSGGLVGATVSFLPSKTNYSTGFALSGLSSNTAYTGTFTLKKGTAQSQPTSVTFKTLHAPVSSVTTTPDKFSAIVQYSTYSSFTPTGVVLGGGLAGKTVSFRLNTSNFSQGFAISNLVGTTTYTGTFKLTGASGAESPSVTLSFTTLSPAAVSDVSTQVSSFNVTVTYSEYTDVTQANEIILSGTFAGRTVSLIAGQTNYASGFVLSNLTSNTLYAGTFILKNGNEESSATSITFTTLHDPLTNVVVTVDKFKVEVRFATYVSFPVTGVTISGDLAAAGQVLLLPLAPDYTQGFAIANLSGDTEYNGFIKLTGAGVQSPTFPISFQTLLPAPISGITYEVSSFSTRVLFDEYTDVLDATDIVLSADLVSQGVNVSKLDGKASFSTGFVVNSLSTNTTYTGTFRLKKGTAESRITPLSFTTLFAPITGVTVTPRIYGAVVVYDAYTDFVPTKVVFSGDMYLENAEIKFLPVSSTYAGGFMIDGLPSGTAYDGTFVLRNDVSEFECPSIAISFTTQNPPAMSNVSVVANPTSAIVTYDEYPELTPSDILLAGAFPGNVQIIPMHGQSDFAKGFVITNLPESTETSGSFILKRGPTSSVAIPLSIKTPTAGAQTASTFVRMALGVPMFRTGNVEYTSASAVLLLNKYKFNVTDLIATRANMQAWIDQAIDVSEKSADDPYVPESLEVNQTVSLYTVEDVLYIHDKQFDLSAFDENTSNIKYYVTPNRRLYSLQTVFFGGSGGADVTYLGVALSGAYAFSADQVLYDSTPEDMPITIHAGVVAQGSGGQTIVAPRIPVSNFMYTADIFIGCDAMNAALQPYAFEYDASSGTVNVARTVTAEERIPLVNLLFATSTYSRNEREYLAEACVLTLTDQVSIDLPDEFRSGEEAMIRLGLSVNSMEETLRVLNAFEITSHHPMFALVQNILSTSWTVPQSFQSFGFSLLRNVVLSVCQCKPSRITGGAVRLMPGDEIIFYITFNGTLRVHSGRALERFGLTPNEIEANTINIDDASWLKLIFRFV